MKRKNILISALFSSLLAFGAISCSPSVSSSSNEAKKDKINEYFKNNNFDFFQNIKSSLLNSVDLKENKDVDFDSFMTSLTLFLNKYRDIVNLELAKPYFKNIIQDDLSLINNKLLDLDKLISKKYVVFADINAKSINDIENVYNKLTEINNNVIEQNNNILEITKHISKNINNQNIKSLLIDNLEKYYQNQDNDELISNLLKISKNIDLINWYLSDSNILQINSDQFNSIRNEYENINNHIDKTNAILSSLEISNDIINKITSYIDENNIVLESLELKKSEVLKLLELKKNGLNEAGINDIKSRISSAKSLSSLNKIADEILEINDDVLQAQKSDLIKKYDSLFSNSNLKQLSKIIIESSENQTDLNKVDQYFSNLQTTLNNLINIITSFKNQSYKGITKFNFYKKLVDMSYIFNDNALVNINLFNLGAEIEKINNFANELEAIINGDQNTQDNQSYDDILLAEANKNAYQLNQDLDNIEKNNSNLYSANITIKNSDIFLSNPDTEYLDYQIYDLELDNTNKNTLVIKYNVFLKSNEEQKVQSTSTIQFSSDLNAIINEYAFANLDQIFNINYFEISKYSKDEWNGLSLENQKEYIRLKNNSLSKFFTFELSNANQNQANKLQHNVLLKFNNQTIKTFDLSSKDSISFRSDSEQKQSYIDRLNKEKIMSLINGPIADILEITKIKQGAKKTHSHYLASQALEAFKNEYELPKFGKYQLIIKDLISFDNKNGVAKLTFWYSENDSIASVDANIDLNSKAKAIANFRLQNYEDIEPINKQYYTAEDFVNNDLTSLGNDLEIMNAIDETNFDFRKAVGKVIADNKYIWYKSLNPKNFVSQQAFNKLPYFIKLVASKDNHGTNLDHEDFIEHNVGIYDKNLAIKQDAENIELLNNKYFIYYYDIKEHNRRGLSFKIAFINKENNAIRYALNKEFNLINLVNDYEQVLYPEIMLNNIKASDIIVNEEKLSTRTAEEFANDLNLLNEAIKLKSNDGKLIYNNFEFSADNFKVAEIKRIAHKEAYIRFKVTRQNWKNENGEVINYKEEILGNTWYKITGFANTETDLSTENLAFNNPNLNKVYLDNNVIYRKRIIEPHYSDLIWNLDKTNNVATWFLDKKYLSETLLKTNSKNRKIVFHFYANKLVNDFNKTNRILSPEYGINVRVDFDKLTKNGIFKQKINFSQENSVPEYSINYIFKWDEQKGISVFVSLDNQEQKIIIDSPSLVKFEKNKLYDANQAFLIMPAGAKITIEYENGIEEKFEDFTNQFNYNKVDYNQTNQPILFYNEEQRLKDYSKYNPNQNVSYKLHDGYKMNVDPIKIKEWKDWDLVNTIMARTMRYTNGTATMIGKVNDDLNDGRFYFLTNHHVHGMDDHIERWEDYSGDKFLKEYDNSNGRIFRFYFTVPYEYVGNNLLPGPDTDWKSFNYIGGYNEARQGFNVKTTVVWTGKGQKDQTGTKNDNADLSIVIWDINPIIKAMKRLGRFQAVKYLENWFKLPNLQFDFDSSKLGFIPGPNIKDTAHIGFPLGDQTGYINHRPKVSNTTLPVSIQDDYAFVRITGGNSGSGFFIDNNRYISTLYGGALSKELYGRNYQTDEYNYFGINWNNENPLTLKNNRSFGAQILRANALNPNAYEIPWFYKKIN